MHNDAAAIGVTVVLWQPDLALFGWMCEGLEQAVPSLYVLRVHINGSEESSLREQVSETASGAAQVVHVTSSAENLGFAGAHNTLISTCLDEDRCDAVLVLNPDVRLRPDTVARLLPHLLGESPTLLGPLLELVKPDTLQPEGRIDSAGIRWTRTGRHLDASQGCPLADAPSAPVRVAGLTGACLLVSRRAFEVIRDASGEFFDADFIAYREDAELGLRAQALGLEQLLIPDARAGHVRQQRGTARGRSSFADYLGVRNRLLIAMKHGRHRPGGIILAPLRDLTVIVAVLVKERSSLPALRDAWRLRDRMHNKRRTFELARGRATE